MFSRKMLKSAVFAAAALLVLAACTPADPVDGPNEPSEGQAATAEPNGPVQEEELPIVSDINPLAGTSWDLVSYGPEGDMKILDEGASVTLDLQDEQAGGRAACNWYGGIYTVQGDKLLWQEPYFNQTEMACEQHLMELEMEFLMMLAGDKTMTLSEDELILTGEAGILVFVPARHVALEGPVWTLTGMPRNGAVVQTWVDARIELLFEDGKVSGSSGCNTVSGGYELDGSRLGIGPLISTLMACEEEIMERESAFLAGLDMIQSFEIHRQTLTMLDGDGNMVMTFGIGENAEP